MPKELLYSLIVAAVGGYGFLAHQYPSLYRRGVMPITIWVMFFVMALVLAYDFGINQGAEAVRSLIPVPDKLIAFDKALSTVKPNTGVALLYMVGVLLYLIVLNLLSIYWEVERTKEDG